MIRTATLADVPRLVEMAQAFGATVPLSRAFPVDPARVSALMTLGMSRDDMTVLVAETDEGAVVGMCGMHRFDHPVLALTMASVVAWWVDPAHRGHGATLLKAGKGWALKTGAKVVQLSIPVGTTPEAEWLARALGFEPTEQSWTQRG